jgi:hypothetical protein
MEDTTTDYVTVKARPARFTWGKVVGWHEVGRYQILEYKGREYKDGHPTGALEGKSTFHVYVDKKSTSSGCPTLEAALVYAIAYANLEVNEARWMAIAASTLLKVPS